MKRILKPKDVKDEMLCGLKKGRTKGTTSYIDIVDPAWTWREGEVNILTGNANEGKSLWLKQLCLIKALEEGKKFVFYSPEDLPFSEFLDDVIHTISGKSTDKENRNYISEDLYNHCYELIKDSFFFLDLSPPQNTIEGVIELTEELMKNNEDIYSIIIDPHVKLARSKNAPDRDDLNGAYTMNALGTFCRNTKIISFLVMHQTTPKLNEQGYYPKPNGYSIKQGGTYFDTADNVLFMWRPYYAKDKLDPKCIFGSQKIKKQKLVGIPQEIEVSFDRKSNRYCYFGTDTSLYNFDKWLPNFDKLL